MRPRPRPSPERVRPRTRPRPDTIENNSVNEVNARRARLVLGWVTVFGRVYHVGM